MGALDKIESIGVLGILAGAGYLIWSNWDKISGFFQNPFGVNGQCPTGYFDTGSNSCCPNGTTFEGGVCKPINVPIIPPATDAHGCYTASEHWCETDGRCLDNAQHCLPGGTDHGRPGACYEWSPTFGQWLYSPNAEGCVPYYEEPLDTSQCGKYTGMCDRAYANVRSWINARSKPLLCNNAQDPDLQTWIAQYMPDDYAEVLRICNGAYDDIPDVQHGLCSDGGLAFFHPPETLAQACAARVSQPFCSLEHRKNCSDSYEGRLYNDYKEVCEQFSSGPCYPFSSGWANQQQIDYSNCLKEC